MGLARTEVGLIRTSLRSLAIGVAWGLGCAILLAWAMPLDLPTDEMRSRMSPTLLDLLVAVISGTALTRPKSVRLSPSFTALSIKPSRKARTSGNCLK